MTNTLVEVTIWLGIWAAIGWVLLKANGRNLAATMMYYGLSKQLDSLLVADPTNMKSKITRFKDNHENVKAVYQYLSSVVLPSGIVAGLLWLFLIIALVFQMDLGLPFRILCGGFAVIALCTSYIHFNSNCALKVAVHALDLYKAYRQTELERLSTLLEEALKFPQVQREAGKPIGELETMVLDAAVDDLNQSIVKVNNHIHTIDEQLKTMRSNLK